METVQHKKNIVPFNGQRYSIWKLRIRALLDELNVLHVIDQEPPEVMEGEPMNEDWNKADRVAKNEIIQYLNDSFLSFAQENNSAKEILRKLDSIYERKSLPSQLAIRKQLLEMKLQGDTPLIKHLTTFDDFIIELQAAGATMTETDKVAHLLLTLPTSYNGVVTALETLSEERITLAFVKTRLLDHEIKLINANTTSLKVLQAAHTKSKIEKIEKPYFRLKNNNRPHQFRRNYTWQSNSKNRNANIRCHHCGRKGHFKRDCFYYKRTNQYQNTKQEDRTRTIQAVQTTSASGSGFAFMAGDVKNEKDELIFLLDSGASDHLVNREDVFTDLLKLSKPMKISVAKNDVFIMATKKGSIQVTTDEGITGILENVLYCPEVPHNLLSVRRIQEAGMSVIFDKTGSVLIKRGGKKIVSGKPLHDLISIKFQINKIDKNNQVIASALSLSYQIWHERLGHIGKQKFVQLKNNMMFEDFNQVVKIKPTDEICESCIFGKQSRLPFAKAKEKSYIKRPLFIIHTDVCGPINPTTYDNKSYFVLFIDAFTHYTVTYLLTYKSEVLTVFKDFVTKSQAHFNMKIVNLYCDNGREYLSNEFKDFCTQEGISYHLTVPYTPQQNSVAERMIRTITEKGRAMISGAGLDKTFWGEAVLTATYLVNRTPTKALNENKTPYELWHNKKPRLSHLRIFGSTVYIHNKTRKTKFDDKSFKGILVGYEPNGYKVWNVENEQCIIVRDVIVDETNFKNSRPIRSEKEVVVEKLVKATKLNEHDNKTDYLKSVVVDSNKSVSETDNSHKDDYVNNSLRKSERIKALPKISYDEESGDYLLCTQSLSDALPTSYLEISTRADRKQWETAINNELSSHYNNKTWSLVTQPINKNIIGCKWIFTIKHDEFGNPSKYKARLVAKGFSQQYLIDYSETFAPVAKISTFRILLAIANQFNLLIHHMDVITAFLHGDLYEEIYMTVPEGVQASSNQVCKLNKSLYGLKQASKCWFELFDKKLKEIGFKNSEVDRCLYILEKGAVFENIYVVLYVDDICIATASTEVMKNFKQYLTNQFRMHDLGNIHFFLGIKIERTKNQISLDQSAYLKTVLMKFHMSDCKAVNTPLLVALNYNALNLDENYNAPSRNLIGCLMYAMLCTRPDLCTAVNILSRYQSKNNKELWQCLKRVLRYIKGTINLKLTYTRNDYKNVLVGYVDSDWGSNESDRKSTSGYVFQLFDCNTICWTTKRQNSVAASSTEAEYMALFEGVREALWLKSLLTNFKFNMSEPIIIHEDNNGCINIANNPINHKRTKHIDIKYHFSREQIELKTVTLKYIPTGKQMADILTKPLPGPSFVHFRRQFGLKEDTGENLLV